MAKTESVFNFFKDKNQKEMPLDSMQKSMFDAPNPYAQSKSEGVTSGSVMSDEDLMKQVLTPSVDFKKETMTEQMAPKSQAGTILDTASTGLMTFGDPNMKAVGLGLMAAKGVADTAQAQRRARYEAEVARAKARQDAIEKMANIGQGLRL